MTEPTDDSAAALAALASQVTLPSEDARAAALSRQGTLTKPAGSLGRLEELSVWLCGVQGACPPRPILRPRLVIFAGDHGVASTAGTSAYPSDVTAQMVLNLLSGGAAANVLADGIGVGVRVIDMAVDIDWADLDTPVPTDLTRYKVRRGSGSLDREDALTLAEAWQGFDAGRAIADQEIDAGADLLIAGDMGIGNTTPAAVVVALACHRNAADVVGRGTGIDDLTWMRKCAAIRDGIHRATPHRGDPIAVLATCCGADFAAMTGFLLQAAIRGVPVILDGLISGACALLANAISYRARNWWLAGHRSTEPAHTLVLDKLGLEPVIDFNLRLGEGSGALLALPILSAAGATLREMATFGDAGVSGPTPPAGE
jgi:nicotinate-nucleotide--dimethylbenzimidazole phosphoribosyltransferase